MCLLAFGCASVQSVNLDGLSSSSRKDIVVKTQDNRRIRLDSDSYTIGRDSTGQAYLSGIGTILDHRGEVSQAWSGVLLSNDIERIEEKDVTPLVIASAIAVIIAWLTWFTHRISLG